MYRIVLLAAALLSASAAAAPAPEPKDEIPIPVLPGGVADADGRTGFFADADGGVIACDLETGNILWEHGDGGCPVALAGGRVLVQTRDPKKDHVLRISALDAAKGGQVLESDAVVLPDWATSREGDWGPHSFHSSTRLYKGDLWLSWQADAGYWGGEPPSPETLKAAEKHADGVVRIHLDSGKVDMLPSSQAQPRRRP